MKTRFTSLTLFAVIAVLAVSAESLSDTLVAYTTGSAGGEMTSSSYSIKATLGQPTAIGISHSTEHALQAGFWYCRLPLAGDADGDCIVGVADLILVRSKLNQVTDSTNWRADVNEDGVINILDLIFVRNNTGAICSD